MSDVQESGAAMPKGLVLGYIIGAATPTRVRRVAAGAVWFTAVLALVASAGLVIATLDIVWEARGWFGGGWTYRNIELVFDKLDRGSIYQLGPLRHDPLASLTFGTWALFRHPLGLFGRLLTVGLILVPGIVLPIFAGAVRRGRRAPCLLAVGFVVPLLGMAFLLTLAQVCLDLVNGLGLASNRVLGGELCWAAGTLVVGISVVLLLKDLCAYLLWIARNPITDKPPVVFVAGLRKGPEKGA